MTKRENKLKESVTLSSKKEWAKVDNQLEQMMMKIGMMKIFDY
jgi:hypothetical protein